MQIKKLDHVNVRTTQLDIMIAWYTEVLGLRSGERPNFPFPGAWMYAGENPVVHLVQAEDPPGVGSEVNLKLEHFAFSATGAAAFKAKLEERGERLRCSEVPSVNIVQFNVWDPDGNHIHVDFSMDD